MRKLFFVIAALLLLAGLLPALPAQAQGDRRCFPQTRQCIEGPIREYWEQNGGLAVFGYPITPLQVETIEGTWTGPVQWFERDRLEDHSNEGLGVMAGRLGALRLEQINRPWLPAQREPEPYGGCRVFPETGYQVCTPFLDYWEQNGGLERFGYPITGQVYEVLEGKVYRVQYFERRRMEYHTELVGTPYAVLLGLLGREVREEGACERGVLPELQFEFDQFARGFILGCPQTAYGGVPGATQLFQYGRMYWMGLDNGQEPIFVIKRTRIGGHPYEQYVDTWQEGEPVDGGLNPPPGLYEPQRGFGKLWREVPGLREQLGWAVAPEVGGVYFYQEFEDGVLFKQNDGRNVWLIYPDGRAYIGIPPGIGF